jgi:hypothetical protein
MTFLIFVVFLSLLMINLLGPKTSGNIILYSVLTIAEWGLILLGTFMFPLVAGYLFFKTR